MRLSTYSGISDIAVGRFADLYTVTVPGKINDE